MILVIDRSKKAAVNLSDMFHYMGFISRGMQPHEALSEISALYRAIIVTSPSALPSAKDYMDKLRAYSGRTPVFGLLNDDEGAYAPLFDKCFKRNSYVSRTAISILEYTEERYLPRPGRYAIAGVDVSVEYRTATFFSDPLPLSKTERMVLRFLIRAYPNPVSAEKILAYAYRPSRMPAASNIRTHISSINKKYRVHTDFPLISNIPGEGYVITATKASPIPF